MANNKTDIIKYNRSVKCCLLETLFLFKERILKMGIFTSRKKKEAEKEFDVNEVESRLDVLNAEKELMKDLSEEVASDLERLMIEEDMIDEDVIKVIPYVKKYGKKLNNIQELVYKSTEIEIKKVEELEKAVVTLELDMNLIRKEMETTNKILERIAKSLEKK